MSEDHKTPSDSFADAQKEFTDSEAEHPHIEGGHFGHQVPQPYFGTRLFELPNGEAIRLNETIWSNLRSALIVEPFSEVHEWGVFTYPRRGVVAGTSDVIATAAHTNIPRDGYSGLPKDWQMLVCRWRAAINMPLDQPVLDWAAETAVSFIYNEKRDGDETLADLILSGATVATPAGDRPVHIRENLGYRVELRTDNQKVMDQLRHYLRGNAVNEATRDAIAELNMLATMHEGALAKAIRGIQAKLSPGRSLTCWIHLEGPLVRTVV